MLAALVADSVLLARATAVLFGTVPCSTVRCLVRCLAHAAQQHVELVPGTTAAAYGDSNNGNSSSSSSTTTTTTSGSSSSITTTKSISSRASSFKQHIQRHGDASRQDSALQKSLGEWQSIARLSSADAQQLLSQHPVLQGYLSRSSTPLSTNYIVNVACLSVHPSQLLVGDRAALRGLLALVPPGLLQALWEQQAHLSWQQQQHHHAPQQPQQKWEQVKYSLDHLQDNLLRALGPYRPQQQLPAGVLLSRPVSGADNRFRRHKDQPEECNDAASILQVSQSLATALGFAATLDPAEASKVQHLLDKAAQRVESKAAASKPAVSSPSSSVSVPSSGPASDAVTAGLTLVLQQAAEGRQLRYKPVLSAAAAAEWVQQLQAETGLSSLQVLQLLLKRPTMLWQHKGPEMPAQLLTHLQQLLPGVAGRDRLAKLVLRQPGLLTRSRADLQAVVDVLTTRLDIDQTQAAELVMQHPQLLVKRVDQLLPSIGFLVGLGLSTNELRSMAIKHPAWLTTSLNKLMLQWRFLQEVIKSSQQDLVLFPQLLTLPIMSRLGPRVMYARKRNIKLLQPGTAAAACQSGVFMTSSKGLQQASMVCLDVWLSGWDKQLCSRMGLNLDDYRRFKQAWGQTVGKEWRSGGPAGRQQLQP